MPQDPKTMDKNTQKILWLIGNGYLPPADALLNATGEPAWTLASVAKMIGFNKHEFIDLVEHYGKRFDGEVGLS